MKLRQRVLVSVTRPEGEEKVLSTARGRLRSRVLRKLAGDRFAVLVLTPESMKIDSVEIRESRVPDIA